MERRNNGSYILGVETMNKILIAVDDTKGTREMFDKVMAICKHLNPEEIILLYVEK
jgi:hypothetical protein